MNLLVFRIVIWCASISTLSLTGSIINSTNHTAWAQAVPLIDIQTGNATLDQGLPTFYDCIEEAVEESYSEDEPNYFHDEPTKAEVNSCYYDAFLTNNASPESVIEAEPNDNIAKKVEMKKDLDNEDTKDNLKAAPQSLVVIPKPVI